jgi:hypothetical protein
LECPVVVERKAAFVHPKPRAGVKKPEADHIGTARDSPWERHRRVRMMEQIPYSTKDGVASGVKQRRLMDRRTAWSQ